jgi:outer membrane protein OmpA-like peptidoglycan-associated protein
MRGAAVLVSGLALGLAACAGPRSPAQRFVVFFTPWSASLDEAAKGSVAAAADWAKQHPRETVTVSGYAAPNGTLQANIDISRARAQVVYDQLVQDGIAPSRIVRVTRGPVDFTLSSLESRRVEIQLAEL